MRGIVAELVDLADAIGEAPLGSDEIAFFQRARIGDRERIALHRLVDRAPDLDDGEAVLRCSASASSGKISRTRCGPDHAV